MTDIATRVYNHSFKIDPIIRSVLDTDFYKLLMAQTIFRRHKDAQVTFGIINRTSSVQLAELVDPGALKEQLGKLGLGKTALVIDGDAINVGFAHASANLREVNLLPAIGANVYDILNHETLVLTRAAVEKLEARFNG